MGRSYAIVCETCNDAVNLYKSPSSHGDLAVSFLFDHPGSDTDCCRFKIINDEDWESPIPQWEKYPWLNNSRLKEPDIKKWISLTGCDPCDAPRFFDAAVNTFKLLTGD